MTVQNEATTSVLAGVGGATALHLAAEQGTELFAGTTIQILKSAAAVPIATQILFSGSICALALRVHDFVSNYLDTTRFADKPKLKAIICIVIDLSVSAAATYALAPVLGLTLATAAAINGVALAVLAAAKLISSRFGQPDAEAKKLAELTRKQDGLRGMVTTLKTSTEKLIKGMSTNIQTVSENLAGVSKKLETLGNTGITDEHIKSIATEVSNKMKEQFEEMTKQFEELNTLVKTMASKDLIDNNVVAKLDALETKLDVLDQLATSDEVKALPDEALIKDLVEIATKNAVAKLATSDEVKALPDEALIKDLVETATKDAVAKLATSDEVKALPDEALIKGLVETATKDAVAKLATSDEVKALPDEALIKDLVKTATKDAVTASLKGIDVESIQRSVTEAIKSIDKEEIQRTVAEAVSGLSAASIKKVIDEAVAKLATSDEVQALPDEALIKDLVETATKDAVAKLATSDEVKALPDEALIKDLVETATKNAVAKLATSDEVKALPDEALIKGLVETATKDAVAKAVAKLATSDEVKALPDEALIKGLVETATKDAVAKLATSDEVKALPDEALIKGLVETATKDAIAKLATSDEVKALPDEALIKGLVETATKDAVANLAKKSDLPAPPPPLKTEVITTAVQAALGGVAKTSDIVPPLSEKDIDKIVETAVGKALATALNDVHRALAEIRETLEAAGQRKTPRSKKGSGKKGSGKKRSKKDKASPFNSPRGAAASPTVVGSTKRELFPGGDEGSDASPFSGGSTDRAALRSPSSPPPTSSVNQEVYSPF